MSIPNGISIFTADKKYSFTVPNDREALFDALCQLWNRHNTPSLSQEHNVTFAINPLFSELILFYR